MKRFACCFVLAIVLCAIANARERYRVNITEQYNPWFNSSTYDIDIRRFGSLIDAGEPVESRLRDVPIGGNLLRIYSALDNSRRVNAEAELLKAQTELLQFQLSHLKEQRRNEAKYPLVKWGTLSEPRQRRQVRNVEPVDDNWAISKPTKHPLMTTPKTKAHVDRGKRKLARVLKLTKAQTQHMYRRIDYYRSKHDTASTKTAAFMYLVYDYKMKSGEASAMVDRFGHYFR